MNAQRILVLAPHTDDGEFGCGGAICKWLEEGNEVYYAAFSSAEKSVPEGLPKDILKKEVKEATKTLGILSDNVFLYNYEVRDFPRFRQEILEDMIQLGKESKPDIVLLPSTHDTHQDHQVISQEGFRAFKKITILGYEVPWNNLTFNTSAFVFLEERHLKKKLASLECYLSQLGRNYATAEFVKSLAITRGTQIGAKYAETFEVIRWVIK
jgi:LmbE family N-acetylglucosaminyl deacetylase